MGRLEGLPPSAPGALAHGEADGFSPALRGLLETFVPAGSCCLHLGSSDRSVIRTWLAGHGCGSLGVDARRAAALPFEDESFDAALLLGVLDQLAEPRPAATELRRVLAPGGVLLVTAANDSYWRHRLDRATRAGEPQPGAVTPGALQRLLLDAGFSLVGVEGQDGAFIRDLPLAGRLCRRRGSGPTAWPSGSSLRCSGRTSARSPSGCSGRTPLPAGGGRPRGLLSRPVRHIRVVCDVLSTARGVS